MDFTLEDWEQLGLDPGDLFWDTALDNYQNLFLLSECPPQPQGSVTALLGDHPWLSCHPWKGPVPPERLRPAYSAGRFCNIGNAWRPF